MWTCLIVISIHPSSVVAVGKEYACSAETGVQSLGQEDSLEKRMATHSSILA